MAVEDHKQAQAEEAPSSDAEKDASKSGGGVPRIVIVGGAVLLVVIGLIAAILWWLQSRHFESSDDAFIDTNISQVAPRASGQVMQVLVTDNQSVTAGQLLVQLDDSAARAQLAQAQATRAQALAQITQAQAQAQVAETQVEQAQANTLSPAAQAANAARDYRRYLAVQTSTPAAVAIQQVDQARTTAIGDAGQLAAARKQVKTSRAQLVSTKTQLGASEAQLKVAEAQIAQAELQMAYARVVSPVDGHIAHKTVAVGDYAQPGQQLMSLVPHALWVTANFKETQLKRMRVGQTVDVKIDAYPNVHFEGHVNSIQRGAGDAFSVLPSQNATGNYVKVVQRVPVKITLDHPTDRDHPLGPGMSAEPRVRVEP